MVSGRDTGPPIVIAEVGVNHNGDAALARKLVEAAAQSGADIVKFQHFDASNLVTADADSAPYQVANTQKTTQADLLRELELSLDELAGLAQLCRSLGIGFLCTAFDSDSLKQLIAMGMPAVKIASGDMTSTPILREAARSGLPVYLSTGMGTLDEVRDALDVLDAAGAGDVTILHCVSLYPAPAETLNLRAMVTMAETFGRPVGYSDHSLDDHAAIAATALGARVIEKHFTLDRSMTGPDHAASLEPAAFAAMVRRIGETHAALGTGIKAPVEEELEVARLVRRSWHSKRPLSAGHVIEESDVILKRPANGLAPSATPVGKTLVKDLPVDSPLRDGDLR